MWVFMGKGESCMTDLQFRNKVTWFSFAFSLLVIWLHSYNAELFLGVTEEMEKVYRAERLIGDWFGQIAVPGFFMISGYLFYRDFRWEMLGVKWQRRIKSVLAPFILWNFIYYLGYVIGSRLPGVAAVVGKGVVPFTLSATVDSVLHYTYNYVFWYLYQLILLICLAPALYPVIKNRWSRVVFLSALWILIEKDVSLPLVNADALVYYVSAASLAIELGGGSGKYNWIEGPWSMRQAWMGAAFLGMAALSYAVGLRAAFTPCFVLCRLLAVAGLWLLVPGDRLPAARDFMCHNFFLYATHFAFVRLINKTAALMFSASGWEPLALFLVMPVLALAISTGLGKILRRLSPKFWNLLNGGR